MKSVAADLSMTTGPVDLVAAAAELGRLDILVNNVGELSPRLSGFLDVTDDQWFASIMLTLMSAGPHNPRSPAGDARRRTRQHRDDRLGERLPA